MKMLVHEEEEKQIEEMEINDLADDDQMSSQFHSNEKTNSKKKRNS